MSQLETTEAVAAAIAVANFTGYGTKGAGTSRYSARCEKRKAWLRKSNVTLRYMRRTASIAPSLIALWPPPSLSDAGAKLVVPRTFAIVAMGREREGQCPPETLSR